MTSVAEVKAQPLTTGERLLNMASEEVSEGVVEERQEDVQSSESQLGILEYLNPSNPGFPGAVIKERYSDFNVTEISRASGRLVRLDSSALPDETPADMRGEEAHLYTSLTEEQRKVFPEEQFNMAKVLNEKENPNIEIDVTERDKEERKNIHLVLKRFGRVDSNTVEEGGRKIIRVKRKKQDNRGHKNWPRDRPRFLHFTLFKQNCETFEAIGGLAAKTHVDPKHFSYAGTKDRRGRTLQRVSVSMTTAKQVLGAAAANWKVEVGDFAYEKFDMKLGDLAGNRFDLAIRNVPAGSEELESALKHFQKHGFINYFGTQRFGTSASVPTSAIGKALLSSHFEEAIDLILRPREFERLHSLREARQEWAESKDPHKALGILKKGGKDRVLEGRLLYGLTKSHQNNHVGALEELPSQQRSMYCHAFQSLLWNRVVSRRVKTHGQAVLVGDLVYKKDVKNTDGESEGEVSKEDLVEEVVEPADWSFTDILIPIPGCRVKWGSSGMKEWFTEELEREGMGWECFSSSVKVYTMPGDYRHMGVVASEVYWSLEQYRERDQDILPSLRELNSRHRQRVEGEVKVEEAENGKTTEDGKDTAENGEPEEPAAADAKPEGTEPVEEKPLYTALVLSLSLPSSTYATMALREILRVETDRASMTRQNDYKRSAAREEGGGPPAKVQKQV